MEYREQVFATLMVNAWEILAKAYIIQQHGEKRQSIYRKDEKRPDRYIRDSYGNPLTMGIWTAINQVRVPQDVKANIEGLVITRNQSIHLGVLSPELKRSVLGFGTGSIQNFVTIFKKWFEEDIPVPYLLPIGFIGAAEITVTKHSIVQRTLLKILTDLAAANYLPDSEYAVSMQIKIGLNRGLSGGGNIGFTNNPAAPTVRVTDDELLEYYSLSYSGLMDMCKTKYVDFKQNTQFHLAMKDIKNDPQCAHKRFPDPRDETGIPKMLYNPSATLARLDHIFTRAVVAA